MDSNQFKKNSKIILIALLVILIIGSIFYIVYSFSVMWQTMAAGFTIGLILIILFLVLLLAAYLWIRNLWLNRELNKYKSQIQTLKREIIRLRSNQNKEEASENKE